MACAITDNFNNSLRGNTMENTIMRVALIALIGWLVWVFHDPLYLYMLLAVPLIGRKKPPAKPINEQLQQLDAKLDLFLQSTLDKDSK